MVSDEADEVLIFFQSRKTADAEARASLPDISKLSGLSINGVNLWGDRKSIEAAMRWEHSHATIDDVRTQLRHWRDECGKLHSQLSKARAT